MSTTKFKVNGVDLTTVFATYLSGTKAANTGYKVSGTDLSDIFAPYVSGTKATTTGINVNGSDLNTVFAPLNIPKVWSAIGGSGLTGTNAVCTVVYIDTSTGYIYIGGLFTAVGGISATNIAMWNGTSWSPIGSGRSDKVYDILVTSSGVIWAAGFFTGKCSYYSSNVWTTLNVGFPNGNTCFCLQSDTSGNIYIGGDFVRWYNVGVNGDHRTIQCWTGTSLINLPALAGPGRNGLNGTCYGLKFNTTNGLLYICGSFTGFYQRSTTATLCYYVCSYDGNYFNIMNPEPVVTGTVGVNGTVKTVTTDPSGNVYFGGTFTMAGTSTMVNNVVKWTSTGYSSTTYVETGTWSPLGIGLNGTVNSLSFYNGILYAGGSFTKLGDVTTTVNYIAQYSNNNWSIISTSLNNAVESIKIDSNGKLIVGGSFTSPYIGLATYG
jgi:hypothetical protein